MLAHIHTHNSKTTISTESYIHPKVSKMEYDVRKKEIIELVFHIFMNVDVFYRVSSDNRNAEIISQTRTNHPRSNYLFSEIK